YLFAQNVENLNSGFYHYNINKRGLEFLRSCTNTKFFKSLFHQDDPSLDQANFAIFLTAIPHRTTEKYGTLGHNLIMIECGQLCQSFWLIASAMNLKVCPHSLINESLFFQTLNINSHQEILLYCLVFGK
ncbi:MAG: SagB/ThcOx family dehydrogenase, partial [Bdellovibrionales bacterium]|nr:SagB/ThcOx family dehydrogenase [Bdellovibrionales bacterium]